jgi:uncharacterized protein YlxP (DUF503 family)
MVIGMGVIRFRIHGCRSLKAKRRVVKTIVSRIHNNFNASVGEVAANDVYQRADIGFAMVGSDRRFVNAKIDKLFNMVEDMGIAEVYDSEMEIMTL